MSAVSKDSSSSGGGASSSAKDPSIAEHVAARDSGGTSFIEAAITGRRVTIVAKATFVFCLIIGDLYVALATLLLIAEGHHLKALVTTTCFAIATIVTIEFAKSVKT